MPKCPVCEKENTSLLCRNCGFDGSRNYEQYPSFGMVPGKISAVSARQKELAQKDPSSSKTWLLRFGWIYVPLQTVYLLFGSESILFNDFFLFPIIRFWIMILSILMQHHLWKKGQEKTYSLALLILIMPSLTFSVVIASNFLNKVGVGLMLISVLCAYSVGLIPGTDLLWLCMTIIYHSAWIHADLKKK